MHEKLKIIHWPDPRLLKRSKPVESFGEDLKALAQRMFELMREARGVGLAAPQVGENIRLFVVNPTGKPEDDRVFVNPVFADLTGEEESEEGCLSLPDLTVKVLRAKSAHIKAQDLEGKAFEQAESGYVARIWQHETDHLNGTLITDKMSAVAKLANRKLLAELREKYEEQNPARGKRK